jgi:P-type Cu+ transporter
MVAEAQRSRAPIQKLADMVSGYFVPAVVLIAALTFAVWGAAGPLPKLAHALINAVAVLIIACPCVLGLATPMSIIGCHDGRAVPQRGGDRDPAQGRYAGRGQDRHAHRRQAKAGGRRPPDVDEQSVLALAAGLERGSEHPLAAAIVRGAEERGVASARATGFESITGKGVKGRIDGKLVMLGNRALMDMFGVARRDAGVRGVVLDRGAIHVDSLEGARILGLQRSLERGDAAADDGVELGFVGGPRPS